VIQYKKYLNNPNTEAYVLDNLSQINWAMLNARDLPDLLRTLRSNDLNKRRKASYKLGEYFREHARALNVIADIQDVLSTDAPVLATPFLLELLAVDDIDNKLQISRLLYTVSEYYLVERLNTQARRRAEIIHNTLLNDLDLFLDLLSHTSSETRANLIYMLGHFPEAQQRIVLSLLEWMENGLVEDEESQMAVCSITFKFLGDNIQNKDRYTKYLREWINSPLTTLSTKGDVAYFLIKLHGDDIDQNTVQLLCNIMKLPLSTNILTPLWDDCVDMFLQLSEPRCLNALLDIFDAQTDLQTIFDVVISLLAIYFNADKYQGIYYYVDQIDGRWVEIISHINANPLEFPLTKSQSIILQHLVDKSLIWEVETNIFRIFGLPSTRDELAKLIIQ